jgi:hypothetical protein
MGGFLADFLKNRVGAVCFFPPVTLQAFDGWLY